LTTDFVTSITLLQQQTNKGATRLKGRKNVYLLQVLLHCCLF